VAISKEIAPDLEWRKRLPIIPATDAFADVAADLPQAAGAGYETRLRDVLAPLCERFDVVLLDTPPGLGTLPGLALLAADGSGPRTASVEITTTRTQLAVSLLVLVTVAVDSGTKTLSHKLIGSVQDMQLFLCLGQVAGGVMRGGACCLCVQAKPGR
jgi:Mrp family chromosome partitioning ATPase